MTLSDSSKGDSHRDIILSHCATIIQNVGVATKVIQHMYDIINKIRQTQPAFPVCLAANARMDSCTHRELEVDHLRTRATPDTSCTRWPNSVILLGESIHTGRMFGTIQSINTTRESSTGSEQ